MQTGQRPVDGDTGGSGGEVNSYRTGRQRVRLCLLRLLGRVLHVLSPLLSRSYPSPTRVPASILVIRPDHLGDLLFLGPALRHLREAFPAALITLFVGPWGQQVMEGSPCVDEVITCPFPGFERQPRGSLLAPYRLLMQQARRLRRRRYDVALVMRCDHWWGALLAATAGIPRRLGYAIPEVQPFLTQASAYVTGEHEVQQNLGLASTLASQTAATVEPQGDVEAGRLTFKPADAEEAWANRWLLLQGAVPERPLVAIHPGAGAPVKLWLVDGWARVADALAERRGAQIVLTGSGDELDLVWAIAARTLTDPLIAAGETTLGQLAALYGCCRLVLGPDCGPLHLAVAMGTPSLHLYGPVDARTFGPWGDRFRHRVVTSGWTCAPCNRLDIPASEIAAHPCVRDISASRVLSEAKALLAGRW